jgi:hypothetical protein
VLLAMLAEASTEAAPAHALEIAAARAADGIEIAVSAVLAQPATVAPGDPSPAHERLARDNGWRLATERRGGTYRSSLCVPI